MMYQWILNADLVVADISTLNANVMYELGVRHALKPYSTIIISESEQMKNRLPFDINHEVIHTYEHLGKDIGYSEVQRFQAVIKDLVKKIIDQPPVDSPVYTFLNDLEAPRRKVTKGLLQAGGPEMEVAKEQTLSHFLKAGEEARKKGDHKTAKVLFQTALDRNPNDSHIRQRLALATYKAKEPDPEAALLLAKELLAPLNPDQSTNPETLGLSGAIEKRLFELKGEADHLENSIKYYERGFYVKQDYYNGINTAYLYLIKTRMAMDKIEALGYYGSAREIWKRVLRRCESLLKEERFDNYIKKKEHYEEIDDDLPWIYATMAEALYGLDKTEDADDYYSRLKALPNADFAMESYQEQKEKMKVLLEEFKAKYL